MNFKAGQLVLARTHNNSTLRPMRVISLTEGYHLVLEEPARAHWHYSTRKLNDDGCHSFFPVSWVRSHVLKQSLEETEV